MTIRIIVTIILSLSVTMSLSQKFLYFPTWNIDSLLEILPDQTGVERVNSLNKLAQSLSYINQDSSMMYVGEAMDIAKQIGYDEGVARALFIYGKNQVFIGNYPESVKYYLKALQLYDKLGLEKWKAVVHAYIATVNYYARNYEKAIENCNKALSIYRRESGNESIFGPIKDTMSIYLQVSLYYFLSDTCDKALDYTLKYLDVGRKNNFDRTDLFLNLILAGERYRCIGEKDSALVYLNRALDFPDENQNIITLKYRAYSALGGLYYRQGPDKQDSAIIYFEKAFKYYSDNGFLFWASKVAETLGHVYYFKKQLDTAQIFYHKAEKLIHEMLKKKSWYRHDSMKHIVSWGMRLYVPMPPGQSIGLMWRNASSVYYYLYRTNEIAGNTEEALRYHIAYSNANDTLSAIRKSEEVLRLQTGFETERYEGRLKDLHQENAIQSLKLKQSGYFLMGLGSLVILIVILAIVLIRQNKLREQQKNLLLQQKLFRSQMNPHFIFNSLTSIQNFIMDADAHNASKYLSRFAKLIRHILDSSIEEYVPLEEEISTIENYLELQNLRFQNKFDFTIEVDKAINLENVNIPPMLAQPFIENSIEHGIKYKKSKGNIFIRFLLKNKCLIFEVEDDGVGREKAQEILYKQNKDHKSLATAITHERIRVLNKKLKKKITLRILDLKDYEGKPAGTKVVLIIPFI